MSAIRNKDQQLEEDESKIKILTLKLAAMKETLKAEDETLKRRINELEKENSNLNELKIEKKKFLQEMKELEVERNKLKTKAIPSIQDQQVIERGRKKLNLYRDLTRIHWDFEASQHNIITGYVTNKQDYIHHFSYKSEKLNSKLTDNLWHEIYLSTCKSSTVGDENREPNIPAVLL